MVVLTEEAVMSYHCSVCMVNWAPYQTQAGVCIMCGGGTRRVQEPVSDGAAHLHLLARMEQAEAQRVAQRAEERRELYARFEAYCAARQPTEPIDAQMVALEAAWQQPAVEPERWWSM